MMVPKHLGGLNKEALDNPGWRNSVVTNLLSLMRLLVMYRLMFNFLTNLCTSIYVWNLSKLLGGTHFKPLSKTTFSGSVSTLVLRLNTPFPSTFWVFFVVRKCLPPLTPLSTCFLIPWFGLKKTPTALSIRIRFVHIQYGTYGQTLVTQNEVLFPI